MNENGETKNPVTFCWNLLIGPSPWWAKTISVLLLIATYQIAVYSWDGTQGRSCSTAWMNNPPQSVGRKLGCYGRALAEALPRFGPKYSSSEEE